MNITFEERQLMLGILSAALCVFRIRVLFCSEMISGAEAAHKIDRMAPSGRSQRRR